MAEDFGTATYQQPLPSFDDYIKTTNIVKRIKNIHGFVFRVEYQKNLALSAPEVTKVIASEGYAVLNDLFESSGIHYLHSLVAMTSEKSGSETSSNDPLVEFRFSHDRFQCRFQLREDNFSIIRDSSDFSDFYTWYSVVMPEALRIETTLRQIIQRTTGGLLRPVQSQFEYAFNFSDFRDPLNDPDASFKPRNMDVLEEIIPQLPGPHRTMTRPADQQLYRLDLTLSKREILNGKARNTWISVEAPFNEGGRFIVVTAQLRNTSAEVLERNEIVATAGFDPNFGDDYRIALIDFLRNDALESFVWQLLRKWEFGTVRTL
jgi:hypothetical protein